ncbi:MAG: HAD-IA family hydrolase, partial [Lachnospiraceae bacterium]|nr:HAD-IA family hydrolase [Lachnospiraceae bacterium]
LLEKSTRKFSAEEKEEMAEQKNNYYKELLKSLTPDSLLPGAKETLVYLRSKGIRTAVGSASKNAPEILKRIGLLPLLDQVSCGLDTTKSKPDPEVFLVAARKLGLPEQVCLVAEDSAAGIQAAKAGHMTSLAVGPLYQQLGGTWQARDLSAVENWEAIISCPISWKMPEKTNCM